MNFILTLLFSILSLIPILAFAQSPATRELKSSKVAVKFEECDSRTLLIELNVAGRTPKADLVEALKLLPDYPSLLFTPKHSARTSLAFAASTRNYCETPKCARDAGFNEIQVRLSRFKGVQLTCAPYDEPASQEQPKQDDGGVTSGN